MFSGQRKSVVLAAAFASAVAAFGSSVRATCGSSNCFLVTGSREGLQSEGTVTIDVSYRYINQSRKLDGSRTTGEVLTPKIDFENREIDLDHHRELRTQNTLIQADILWGVTERLTLDASLPLVNDRDHEHFDEVGTPGEFFTKDDGSSGFGDLRLGGRYAFVTRARDLFSGSLAVELPTGAEDLSDSEGEINEPTIQPGSGSTDVILGADYSHQWIPDRLETFVSISRKINGESDLDYQFGVENVVNAGARWQAGRQVRLSLQLNHRRTAHDQFLGRTVPSTGSTLVNLTPGLEITRAAVTFYAFAQIPIHQDVNEAQLTPRTSFLLGVSRSF